MKKKKTTIPHNRQPFTEEILNAIPIENELDYAEICKCIGKMEQIDKDMTFLLNKEKINGEGERK